VKSNHGLPRRGCQLLVKELDEKYFIKNPNQYIYARCALDGELTTNAFADVPATVILVRQESPGPTRRFPLFVFPKEDVAAAVRIARLTNKDIRRGNMSMVWADNGEPFGFYHDRGVGWFERFEKTSKKHIGVNNIGTTMPGTVAYNKFGTYKFV
jgi:hypothetical protein